MNDTDLLLTEAVKAILLADRPAGLSAVVTVTAESGNARLTRPYLLIACENGSSPHPQMRRCTLQVALHTQADSQTPEAAAGWHAAAVDYLLANPAAIAATLAPYGWAVKKFTPGAITDEDLPNRERGYLMEWLVVLQKV